MQKTEFQNISIPVMFRTIEPMVDYPLTVHPAANGYLVETLGDKGGEERNWPPYLTKPMA